MYLFLQNNYSTDAIRVKYVFTIINRDLLRFALKFLFKPKQ